MGLLSWRKAKKGEPGTTSAPDALALVAEAQAGRGEAREDLLRAYSPFAMRVASDVCGRYITAGEDDEASVALLAFNEAITNYRQEKGGSFFGFAETVIRRRLIDHFRRQKGRREVPFSELEVEDEEGGSYLPVEVEEAQTRHQARSEMAERQEEIARYQALLAQYGITLADLVANCPKHRDARESAQAVARTLAQNPAWVKRIMTQRSLPLRELEKDAGVSRKTLERNRKYIIAVVLILIEDFVYLKEYVEPRD